jgi:hypothetical protein
MLEQVREGNRVIVHIDMIQVSSGSKVYSYLDLQRDNCIVDYSLGNIVWVESLLRDNTFLLERVLFLWEDLIVFYVHFWFCSVTIICCTFHFYILHVFVSYEGYIYCATPMLQCIKQTLLLLPRDSFAFVRYVISLIGDIQSCILG